MYEDKDSTAQCTTVVPISCVIFWKYFAGFYCVFCWVFAWFYPFKPGFCSADDVWLDVVDCAANSEVLSFMLLQFNVIILRFLLVGMLNTLLLLFLLLLLLHFDVSMLAELFLFGLLAFSGLKVFEVTDSNVMLCVRGS
jgi:hypothetical protein